LGIGSIDTKKNQEGNSVNPQPPSDAVRQQKKNILQDLFSSVLSQFNKYHPFGNLKFNNLGIFQNLKLRILMGKILPISLKLNSTPNTVGSYGLSYETLVKHIGSTLHRRPPGCELKVRLTPRSLAGLAWRCKPLRLAPHRLVKLTFVKMMAVF